MTSYNDDSDNNTNDDDQKDVDKNKVSDSISSDLKPEYTVEFYLNKIPTDRKLIYSLAKDRNFALNLSGNMLYISLALAKSLSGDILIYSWLFLPSLNPGM